LALIAPPCKIRGEMGEVSEWKRRSVIVASGGTVRFSIYCSIWKAEHIKRYWRLKIA